MSQSPQFPDGLRTANLPRISLARLRQNDELEAARLFKACIDYGCFLLDLTTIADASELLSDINRASSIGDAFFDATLKEKMQFQVDHRNVGYKPLGALKLPKGGRDSVEIYSVSKDRILDPSNQQIAMQFIKHRSFLSPFIIERLHPIAMLVLQLIAKHLDIQSSTLRHLHSDTIASGTVLRFLHYPKVATDAHDLDGGTKLLGHTDNGSLTILFTSLGGLQILPPGADEQYSSAWEWVKPEPGCCFINVGDSLVQWTGGILRSVYHRVVRPPGRQSEFDRYSFGYFLKPADTAPMQRLQEGLIPDNDVDEDSPVSYESWHQNKSKNIYSGINGVSRGGTVSVPWKNQGLVEARS